MSYPSASPRMFVTPTSRIGHKEYLAEKNLGFNGGFRRLQTFLVAVVTFALCQISNLAQAQGTAPLFWLAGSGPTGPQAHFVLTVSAKVQGRSCKMQLDTGLNEAVRWQEVNPGAEGMARVKVSIAGLSTSIATPRTIARHLRDCGPDAPVGSLGNALFEHGSLTLDLAKMQLRYQRGSVLAADAAAEPMHYVRWTAQGGHPLVEIRQDSALVGDGLLDTGSASFGFAPLSQPQWDRVTSSAPLAESKDVRTFPISSWGRQHTCFDTAPTARLQAGHWDLKTSVTYCPELGFNPPQKLEGIVGLAAFSGAVITIDYRGERWRATRE